MNSIIFKDGSQFTFNELVQLKQNERFIRTAHPGNFDSVTVFIAKYFEVILREDITFGADIYHPEFIISNFKKNKISKFQPNIEVCSLKIVDSNDCVLEYHYRELMQRFSYIKRGIDEITKLTNLFDVLNIIVKSKPDEFDKYYTLEGIQYKLYESSLTCNLYKDKDGNIITIKNDKIINLYKNHIKKLSNAYLNLGMEVSCESLDISNNLFHVILILNQINSNHQRTLYHLCGNRMYEYLYKDSRFSTQNQKNINNLFAIINKNSRINFNFFLIPTKQFKNFIKNIKIEGEYFSIYELLQTLKGLIKKEKRKTLEKKETDFKNKIINLLLNDCTFTQYDMSINKEIDNYLEIPKEFMNTSLIELERINKSCESLLARIKKYEYNIRQL